MCTLNLSIPNCNTFHQKIKNRNLGFQVEDFIVLILQKTCPKVIKSTGKPTIWDTCLEIIIFCVLHCVPKPRVLVCSLYLLNGSVMSERRFFIRSLISVPLLQALSHAVHCSCAVGKKYIPSGILSLSLSSQALSVHIHFPGALVVRSVLLGITGCIYGEWAMEAASYSVTDQVVVGDMYRADLSRVIHIPSI